MLMARELMAQELVLDFGDVHEIEGCLCDSPTT